MKFAAVRFPRLSLLVLIALVASLTGCDSTSSETIVLDDIRIEAEFEFNGNELVTGELQDLVANGVIDVGPTLTSRGGFTKSEIVTGRVKSASIELIFPTAGQGFDLRFLNAAILQFRAGSTVREVASRTGFTNQEPASLNVIQGRDIAAILRAASFQAILQVDPSSLDPAESYEIMLIATLTVEVEGV